MKSRKYLKKQIKDNFNKLYQEIFFYETFVVNADSAVAQSILDEMLKAESNLLKRVSTHDGKYVKGRVKIYFSKLKEDLRKDLDGFKQKINSLVY